MAFPTKMLPSGPSSVIPDSILPAEFVPFSAHIPLWITGPVVVESMIPQRLVLVRRGSSLCQDTAWVDILMDVCPPEDKEVLWRMLQNTDASSFMRAYDDALHLEHFMNRKMTSSLLCEANSRVCCVDSERVAHRLPTWRDGVLHLLGIKPFR